MNPPMAAPPSVPAVLSVKAEPATPPTTAPTAVFLSRVDMPEQPARTANARPVANSLLIDLMIASSTSDDFDLLSAGIVPISGALENHSGRDVRTRAG